MSEVVAVVNRAQAERGYLEPLNRDSQCMAVRSLPENEEVIKHMFGDKIIKGGDSDPYDWQIQSHVNAGWYPPAFRYGASRGKCQHDVQRGDWITLSGHGLIYAYTPEKFEAEWFITGSVSELRVSNAINSDHLPPRSEWTKPNIDNLPPKSEWAKLYWKENR